MKPYSTYKPTNVEWIGEIPKHWEVKRLKYVAVAQPSNVDKKSYEDELPVALCNYVDVYKNDYIDDSISFMQATATQNEIEKFKLKIGDVIITKDSETREEIAIPALVKYERDDLICGYHLTQIRADNISIIGDYVFRLFQTKEINANFESSANGVTRYALGSETINGVYVLLPPVEEQTAISNFLDNKTKLIDGSIKKKQQLIELLKEERTAVINNAVTKGINPKAKVKPSGIEWLGDIPKHWEVKRLKFFARIRNGQDHKAVWDENGNYPIIGTGGVFGKASSPLYSEVSVLLGRKGTIDKPQFLEEPFWCVDTAYYTEIFDTVNPKFFFYCCTTINFDLYKYGSAVPSMTQQDLSNIHFCYPPLEEQNEIVSYIEITNGKINKTIANLEKEIELLHEYRTALISEVVTGKVDVRTQKN